jgi:hypothetical protein
MKIKTPSTEKEMEESDYLVCGLAAGREAIIVAQGDILADCCRCNAPIYHDAEAPTKPKKLCMHCAIEMWDAHLRGGRNH